VKLTRFVVAVYLRDQIDYFTHDGFSKGKEGKRAVNREWLNYKAFL
jgi:hypothetical protein